MSPNQMLTHERYLHAERVAPTAWTPPDTDPCDGKTHRKKKQRELPRQSSEQIPRVVLHILIQTRRLSDWPVAFDMSQVKRRAHVHAPFESRDFTGGKWFERKCYCFPRVEVGLLSGH